MYPLVNKVPWSTPDTYEACGDVAVQRQFRGVRRSWVGGAGRWAEGDRSLSDGARAPSTFKPSSARLSWDCCAVVGPRQEARPKTRSSRSLSSRSSRSSMSSMTRRSWPSSKRQGCLHWISIPRQAGRWLEHGEWPLRDRGRSCDGCSRSSKSPYGILFRATICLHLRPL